MRWRCTKKEVLQAAGNSLAVPREGRCAGKPGNRLQEQVAAGCRRSHEPAESQLAEPGEPDEALARDGSRERA